MKTLQQVFDEMIINQNWLFLSFTEKLNLLCGGKKERAAKAAQYVAGRKATTTAKAVKTNKRNKRTAAFVRGSVIFSGVKPAVLATATAVLRALGRVVCPTTAVQEVMQLNISYIDWRGFSDAVLASAVAKFMAAVAA